MILIDTIIIVGLIALFFGITLVLYWLRKHKIMIFKNVLGVIALSIGLVIVVWIIYNIFYPTEEFRSSHETVFQFVGLIGLIATGISWVTYKGPGIEEQEIDYTAPEITHANKRAKDTIPQFVELIYQNLGDAYIKIPFRTDTDGQATKYTWAYVNHYGNGIFNVFVIGHKNRHCQLLVNETDVEDWQIVLPDKRIRGNYSAIGAFEFVENRGIPLSKRMKMQKMQLIDAQNA